jgi:2-keto-4-pentenoate hydratase/2-oxohepta-3-ene-1,7-dioic acid hydratase in catechol pathway
VSLTAGVTHGDSLRRDAHVRLARFAHDGQALVGVVDEVGVRPLGNHHDGIAAAIRDPDGARLAAGRAESIPFDELTLLPPVDAAARVFAVAQNYPAHAREQSGADVPPAPIIFLKPLSALVGDGAPIALPPITAFLDYEAELAIVIGADARAVDVEAAGDAIFGVTCFNDVTGRDLQPAVLGGREQTDWFSAKSLDGSSPVGPWIVSRDELNGDPGDLRIRCRVNDETVQDDRTSSMARGAATLISFISQRVALHPGDVIATGTPAGVGRARGVNLKDGDVVEVEIEGIGILRNRVTKTG